MGNYMDNTYLAIDGVIVSYSGSDDVLTVPSRLIQMDIVRIGDGSFMDSRMSKVIISDGIKEIGKNAFSKCCNLKEVVIPASVTTVCSNAFTNDLPKLDSIFDAQTVRDQDKQQQVSHDKLCGAFADQ